MNRSRQRRVLAAAASMALVGGVFSLLIWGKLRLVGPVPRSAYAEPAPTSQNSGAADEASTLEAHDHSPGEHPKHEGPDAPTSGDRK